MNIVIQYSVSVPEDTTILPLWILHPEIQAAIFALSPPVKLVEYTDAPGTAFFYVWDKGQFYTRVAVER